MHANRYQDLRAWQQAIELVEQVYSATAKLPQEEVFGLKSQLRRCAVSIPSNIAEGQELGRLMNALIASLKRGAPHRQPTTGY